MPTYVVSAAAGRFSQEEKEGIARGITQAHGRATGAQGFFAQVIFHWIAADDHFLGGRVHDADHVTVHGTIRAGRTAEQKSRLLEDIVGIVAGAANTGRRHVWVYLAELPPAQMAEYGRVLPQPGGEAGWLEALPAEDRDYLLGLDK
ncbi:tautomerase family protein [Burkholderia plantarii]|uniref:tautomerase family protein n=1 Tax=Burkholderia plantarii TaxID=41899 RepID=UPI0008706CC1|nr:tautomerase family protein [Burkholderia plantarii]